MSWRVVVAALTVIFLVVVIQSSFAGPLEQTSGAFSDVVDGDLQNENFDDDMFDTLPNTWYDMGLIVIFGLLGWGTVRVVRRELTRGRV